MTDRPLTPVVDGFTYLEGPRWHDGRLWLSDFYSHKVVAVTPEGKTEEIVTVPAQPSGLGWLPDGTLLVVSMRDRKLLRLESGELVEHADLTTTTGGHVNDMVVDGQGRAYVGDFGFDLMGGAPFRTANLTRVDPDGTVSVAAEDLMFPNGSVITPDGKTLIVGETFGNRISAFDIGSDGELGPRRDWAHFGTLPDTDDVATLVGAASIGPDGNCLDADGAVWVADAIHHRCVRVAEGGEILEEISTGDEGVFACMLGGDDGRTLFLCVAPNFDEGERSTTTLGRLVSTRVDVPHAGTP
ncbi:SMP-30/gluconolactonase/LRE family protein [Pseudonocardia parietis]|uniref:Sugar lactone lactonase YvrE n=1 Tax=Pseudonocardia parietis TaxID=570936 RepID=A0ABS4VMH0_9PSEU|nr:SMP-30/gluconolactonase/LRE family protein [Pseudonocardia parietis]MBP2365095.1 sugar lactone lactonase YvrE [Pseudonocardia parietis]